MQKTPPIPRRQVASPWQRGVHPVTGKSEEKKAFHNMLIDILCSIRLIHSLSLEAFDKWPTWAPNETSVSRRVRNFLTFHQPHVVC
ncbi:hypothetical protein CEXT_487131 [Caerostris extrusa]|uniref:Uncharacterized protein n=1 Tax=Caerostris extrusa TaxID=172846 RepID=A0AAV4MFF9_CAEEX|nr:hypothetical protein CEXT_487131 [Caerostris extrusa]